MSQYTTDYLMNRYRELMQEYSSEKTTVRKKFLIGHQASQYIEELWRRNGGWNG